MKSELDKLIEELEAGTKIDPPKAGMDHVEAAAPPQRKVAVTCWHCQGEKTCDCLACWQNGPGECVTCKGTGQVWRWVQ